MNEDLALEELQVQGVPAASVVCSEQRTPPILTASHIARARAGFVEDLLDFGVISGRKEVAFVPYGQQCNNAVQGEGERR
jgi:hypothetical protein